MTARTDGLRVLVVDDCPDTVWSLASLLGIWGHAALTAADGDAAVRVAAAEQPDVVLLDIGLPGLDGFEVARRLRQMPGERQLIIAMSGYAGDHYRRQAEEAGCDQHWVKPVEPYILQDLLIEHPLRLHERRAITS